MVTSPPPPPPLKPWLPLSAKSLSRRVRGSAGRDGRSAEGRRLVPQPGQSRWAAERPLDRTPSRRPARPSLQGMPLASFAAPNLPRHSRACPGPPSGWVRRTPQAAPSPSPRALLGAQPGPATSASLVRPGQDRAGRCLEGRALHCAPASGLRRSEPSDSGGGAQAVPGGGALEPGLDFSPCAHAAGWGRGGGQWERPGQAMRLRGAGSRRRGGCGFRTQCRGRPRDFGPPGIREANKREGTPVGGKSASRESEGAARIPRPFPPPAENGGEQWEGSWGWSSVWGLNHPLVPTPPVHGLPHPPKRAPLRAEHLHSGTRAHTGSDLGSTFTRLPGVCAHGSVCTRVHILAPGAHLPSPPNALTPRPPRTSAPSSGLGRAGRAGRRGRGLPAPRAARTARSNFPSRVTLRTPPVHRRAGTTCRPPL